MNNSTAQKINEMERTIRYQQLLLRMLIHAIGTPIEDGKRIRVAAKDISSFDAFAPSGIYRDQISGDVILQNGKISPLSSQWVCIDKPNVLDGPATEAVHQVIERMRTP